MDIEIKNKMLEIIQQIKAWDPEEYSAAVLLCLYDKFDTIKPNPDISLEVKALEKVYGWALANPRNFLVGDKQPLENHADAIYGWWTYPKFISSGNKYEFLDLNKQELEKFLKSTGYERPLGIFQYWRNHDITVCDTNPNGKKSKDGTKKLLTFAAHHYYQYNKPAQRKGIIRIRIDKIKELVEIIDTEEEIVRQGLVSFVEDLLTAKQMDEMNKAKIKDTNSSNETGCSIGDW